MNGDYVYIAVKPCGCVDGVCIIDDRNKAETIKMLTMWIEDDYLIDRVGRTEGIRLYGIDCTHGEATTR